MPKQCPLYTAAMALAGLIVTAMGQKHLIEEAMLISPQHCDGANCMWHDTLCSGEPLNVNARIDKGESV